MNEIVKTLRAAALFSALSDEELDRVARRVTTSDVAGGTILFAEGAAPDGAWFIQTGEVRIGKGRGLQPGQFQRFLATLGPGSVFGEMSLILDEPRSAAALVTKDARLHRLDRETFDELLAARDEVAWHLMRGLLVNACTRLRDATAVGRRPEFGQREVEAVNDGVLQLGWR